MTTFMKKAFPTFLILLTSAAFQLCFAADATPPKFNCTLTDQMADGTPGDAKDTFPITTAMIYLVCDSSDVQKGDKVKTTWIAADTHNLAPENYKIDEKSFDITESPADGQVWTLNASLSKPTNGWPIGSYHVDVYVGDKLVQTIKFNVK